MTWIKTVRPSDGGDRLRQARAAQHALYPPEYEQPVLPVDDEIAGIVAAHSLIPDALHHAFATFGALMSPELPLSRRQHEMIATVVSVTNRCSYCSLSHAEFLRRVTLDDALVDAIRRDFRTAPIEERDKAMLDYAAQVTLDAGSITAAHHERLRAAGFDDRAILQITLIAAWFNYINRVADSLGVGRP
jgi:uncharacterized peroxidase-related enzyme